MRLRHRPRQFPCSASPAVRKRCTGGSRSCPWQPNALPPEDFARPFDALAQHLPLEKPTVSIELDPSSHPVRRSAGAGGAQRLAAAQLSGFTDDHVPVLIGLRASAISSFPDLLAQNEKNAGRYRMMLSKNQFSPALRKRRTADDQRRGAIIEGVLCERRAWIDTRLLRWACERLSPYMQAGRWTVQGNETCHPAPRFALCTQHRRRV